MTLRKKYKKVKDWRSLIKGPWIHQNTIETVNNIKSNKNILGGLANESDGYCAALPYFLYGYSLKNVENIIKLLQLKNKYQICIVKIYILDFGTVRKTLLKNLKKNSKKIPILKA